MAGNPYAGLPPRPRDVGEWEDLLVRFELAPRALRLALDVAEGGPDAAGAAMAPVAERMRALAEREAEAWSWLRRLSAGGKPPAPDEPDAAAAGPAEALRGPLERFTQLRARNFAWVQRRGLEVWEWQAPHPGGGTVSAFQLIAALVRTDGAHLAGIRQALREVEPC